MKYTSEKQLSETFVNWIKTLKTHNYFTLLDQCPFPAIYYILTGEKPYELIYSFFQNATPLEAFKTDVFFSKFFLFLFYPSINFIQLNTQLVLIIIFFFIFLLVFFICFSYFNFSRFLVSGYLALCAFYAEQLTFAMRNYFVSFFTILFIIGGFNIIGLIPFCGSFTAQIIVNLVFTIATIGGLIFMGFNTFGIQFLYTFIPKNVPFVMIPFLFIIEILSFLMRIFSMSIRLFSNMVAGHSLLHLIYEFIQYINFIVIGSSLGVIIALVPLVILYFWLFFELFVAFLQAYVFVLLYLLYINDITKSH